MSSETPVFLWCTPPQLSSSFRQVAPLVQGGSRQVAAPASNSGLRSPVTRWLNISVSEAKNESKTGVAEVELKLKWSCSYNTIFPEIKHLAYGWCMEKNKIDLKV